MKKIKDQKVALQQSRKLICKSREGSCHIMRLTLNWQLSLCGNKTHKEGRVDTHSLYGCGGGGGDYHHHNTVDEVLCL